MIDRYRQELEKIKSIANSSDQESRQLAIDLFFTSDYAIENGINLDTIMYNKQENYNTLRSFLDNDNPFRFLNIYVIIEHLLQEIITFKNENS